jgi:hypothetical protein
MRIVLPVVLIFQIFVGKMIDLKVTIIINVADLLIIIFFLLRRNSSMETKIVIIFLERIALVSSFGPELGHFFWRNCAHW